MRNQRLKNYCQHTKWSEVYLIGDEKVDLEYKKLFELANNILESEHDKEIAINALKELIKYSKFYFANEDRYTALGYIDLETHRTLHKNIVENLNKFIQNVATISQLKRFLINS